LKEDADDYLAMSLSILWTQNCDKADITNNDKVNFADLALFANYWLEPSCPTGSNCTYNPPQKLGA
jgi:hypothetical protein